ncbi:MAG: alpha/beta fold hydrolase [Solirubrobacteraceae bacterium]
MRSGPGAEPPAGPEPAGATALEVLRAGLGPPVVLVHGSVVGAGPTWRAQLALAERWSLRMPNRPGFGGSPPLRRGDFELEAPLIAALLGGGAHLVGHSYGAVIAIYAAALRPGAVRSLTLSEPGCLAVAAGLPAVDRQLAAGRLLYEQADRLDPREFLLAFRGGAGVTRSTPERLPDELFAGARLLMAERPPWEADPPWQRLRDAPFAKLVLSGGHSEVFEAVCDAVAERIGARRRVIAGRGHTIPAAAGYNDALEGFLSESERIGAGGW